jgi:hypothetical protein
LMDTAFLRCRRYQIFVGYATPTSSWQSVARSA